MPGTVYAYILVLTDKKSGRNRMPMAGGFRTPVRVPTGVPPNKTILQEIRK
jgi:hypothetical protein